MFGNTVDAQAHMLDAIEHAAVIFDLEGRYLHVNSAAEAVIRQPRSHLLGRSYREDFPEMVGGPLEEAFVRVARGLSQVEQVEADHDRFDARYDCRFVRIEDTVLMLVRDIKVDQRVARDRDTLARITDQLGRASTAAEIEAVAARELGPRFDARAVTIAVGAAVLPAPDGHAWSQALEVDGRIVGTLTLHFDDERTLAPSDPELVRTSSQQLAQALERALLMERSRRQLERAEALSRIGAVLHRSLDWREALRAVAEAALGTLADWCSIDMLGPTLPTSRVVVARDPAKHAAAVGLGGHAPGVASPVREAIRTGRGVLIERFSAADLDDPRLSVEHRRLLVELGVASAIAVPIRIGEEMLGGMIFVSSDPARRYGLDDLAFAEEIADRAGLALDNARAHTLERAARAELVASQQALERSEARLRFAIDAAGVGTWELDVASGTMQFSEQCRAMHGLPDQDVVEWADVLATLHPGDRERAEIAWQRALDPIGEGELKLETRVIGRSDRVERFVLSRGRVSFDDAGRPRRCVGIAIDVTDERAAARRTSVLSEASRAFVEAGRRPELALGFIARILAWAVGDLASITMSVGDEPPQEVALEANVPAGTAVDLGPVGPMLVEARDHAWRQRCVVLSGTVIAAPMVVGDTVVGVIACARRSDGRPYRPHDLHLLQDVAERAAMALSEAHSFRRAEEAHRRLHAITDNLPVLISSIDHDLRYRYLSGGYERWFGRPVSALLGQRVIDVVGPVAFAAAEADLRAALAGETRSLDVELPPHPTRPRHVRITFLPQTGFGGTITGVVALVVDTTEQTAMVEHLQRTIRFTDEVVGILGHDLRSPLTSIVMGAEQLLELDDSSGLVRPLMRIRNSAERMTRMIEQILDFTRARLGGGIPIVPGAADLRELAGQLIDEQAAVAGQVILLEARGDCGGWWDGDRLSQVIGNLLGNAIQHGHPDRPIRVTLDGTADPQVILAVSNHGAIPAELLPGVFEPFRGKARRAGQRSGLGLGLYIVQQIVDAHGGRIEVDSTTPDLTCFVVTLPRRR